MRGSTSLNSGSHVSTVVARVMQRGKKREHPIGLLHRHDQRVAQIAAVVMLEYQWGSELIKEHPRLIGDPFGRQMFRQVQGEAVARRDVAHQVPEQARELPRVRTGPPGRAPRSPGAAGGGCCTAPSSRSARPPPRTSRNGPAPGTPPRSSSRTARSSPASSDDAARQRRDTAACQAPCPPTDAFRFMAVNAQAKRIRNRRSATQNGFHIRGSPAVIQWKITTPQYDALSRMP